MDCFDARRSRGNDAIVCFNIKRFQFLSASLSLSFALFRSSLAIRQWRWRRHGDRVRLFPSLHRFGGAVESPCIDSVTVYSKRNFTVVLNGALNFLCMLFAFAEWNLSLVRRSPALFLSIRFSFLLRRTDQTYYGY